ncbi:hypothetical protein I350_05601 [Cryptococcus amylolentus CBS 6273]|uniref:Meiotic nuclear division protein 1 n=1 Tax=Cryptococcus amylolentus CBS 6273 TaxID=1296118 RepID=A0A1E3JVV5_9TREE|nr:hypothetical protein I350_05601 [Cryptococcus amylolentus CBS 6273]
MSKRGLSMEEKKTKMVEIFHGTVSTFYADRRAGGLAEFFSLKELEKIAPKQKGIVQQSVKEVLDDLVSDGLVTMDKIGTGNYYWALSSAAGATKIAALAKHKKELDKLETSLGETKAALDEADQGREDTPERQSLISTLSSLQSQSTALQAKLSAFGAADPIKYEKKKQAIDTCKEGAVRWTDNVMILMQYAGGLGVESGQVRGFLEIDEDWDDLKV